MTVIEEVNPEGVAIATFDHATLQTVADLAIGDVLSPIALHLPAEMEYESYETLGTALGAFDRACKWWVGDWLIHGESQFPDRYAQACRYTGLSEHTLLNRVTVSRGVPAERRRPLVSYSCHALVAPLTAEDQDRWLTYAEENQSTVAELTAAIKEAKAAGKETNGTTPDVGSGEVMVERLIEVARIIVGSAEVVGENVIIKRDYYSQLVAALGEEE